MMLLGKIALGGCGTAVLGVGLLCSEGFVNVRVLEKKPQGHDIYIVAPAMIAPIAMHFVPKRHIANTSADIRPWLPAIRAGLDQLRESDDVTLVEVKDRYEHVQIAKRCGSIVVDVDDNDETVHVSTPIGAISSTIEQLAAATPDTQP
jgi:hypothetical protein